MKRRVFFLLLGLPAGALAFALAFWIQTRPHRLLLEESAAELAWLRHEFHLTDLEFERVSTLHLAYRPTCELLCQRIADSNRRLREAVAATNTMTEEVLRRIQETGKARDDCRQAMLTHLFAVAREMPPEQGRRYLDVMLAATCVLQETRPLHSGLSQDSSVQNPGVGDSPHAHHE